MNFVFVSPHFPDSYWRFCQALKNNGVNVLGIVEGNDESLSYQLKNALTAWYCVKDLHNFDEKVNACRYFEGRFGKLDFIESNNEFWLEDDARLRTIFDVTTGPKEDEIAFFKFKSVMKEDYAKAGIKTARYHLFKNLDEALEFAHEVGYPIVIKPDNGVGAAATFKVRNDQELIDAAPRLNDTVYIMEEFIDGDLISFDGVCDSQGNVVYPTHHVFPTPIMDIVNEWRDVMYYTAKDIPADLMKAGQKVLKAFGAKSRFYHLEFFRLRHQKKGLGKKGDLIGLEVNMRVPGGYTPDMINFSYSVDIYQIWADVMAFDKQVHEYEYPKHFCCYIGRRYNVNYEYSIEGLLQKHQGTLKWAADMPEGLSRAMGNYFIMANFDNLEDLLAFSDDALKRA